MIIIQILRAPKSGLSWDRSVIQVPFQDKSQIWPQEDIDLRKQSERKDSARSILPYNSSNEDGEHDNTLVRVSLQQISPQVSIFVPS